MGWPVPWPILFDHTCQKDKGKGPYADKKSEAVAVNIHFYCNKHRFLSCNIFLKELCNIF